LGKRRRCEDTSRSGRGFPCTPFPKRSLDFALERKRKSTQRYSSGKTHDLLRCRNPIEEGGSGDPSPMTAFGVMERIKALAEEVLGSKSLVGIRVAIQGLGKVGMSLVE
jgi:hypothetical protein